MKNIQVTFPYDGSTEEDRVFIQAIADDVSPYNAANLRFAFFDEDGNPVDQSFDEEEFTYIEELCIEMLFEQKEDLMREQLIGDDEYMM